MRAYLSNLVGGFSHLLNALTGAPAKHSFSAWSGFRAQAGVKWRKGACAVINFILRSRNHCLEHAREEGLL